jgi:hypothetical protein
MSGRKRKRTYNTSGLRRGLAAGASFNASCSYDRPEAPTPCGSEDSDEGIPMADSTGQHCADGEEDDALLQFPSLSYAYLSPLDHIEPQT